MRFKIKSVISVCIVYYLCRNKKNIRSYAYKQECHASLFQA